VPEIAPSGETKYSVGQRREGGEVMPAKKKAAAKKKTAKKK
jgi:hypothetical protein